MTNSNLWITIPARRPGARLRLFCLPYVGGGTAKYFPWLKELPETIELCLVRLPGRESRLSEPAFTHIEPLVDGLVKALEPLLDKPLAVFGHSMGALIGFELLRRLEDEYSVTACEFFASGRRAPHIPDPEPALHALPDDLMVQKIQQRYNGIPRSVFENKELLQLFLPTLRADVRVLETYTYHGGKLDCPIFALGGREDEHVSKEDLAAWGQVTGAGFQVRTFPGDHFYLQPQQSAVLAAIVSDLGRSQDEVTRVTTG